MGRAPATFKQNDVTRALRAAIAAGHKVRRVEIGPSGLIVMILDESEPEAMAPSRAADKIDL
jgi:hypothetical protein